MTLNILKSEDIIFTSKSGERLHDIERLDLEKVATIEGVSEYSVLQLEHKGESYLLTEEFNVEATLETLDEFMEEYDEEDEEEFSFDAEEEFNAIVNADEVEERDEEEFRKEVVKKEEQRQHTEQEESVQIQLQHNAEVQQNHQNTSHFLYKNEIISVTNEPETVVNNLSVESIDSAVNESVLVESSEIEEISQSIEETIVEESFSLTNNAPLSQMQYQTLITNSIEQTKLEEALLRMEKTSLREGDLTLLGITNLTDNANNITRVNNILEDAGVTIGSDTTELQALVDVLIKIDAKDGDSTATNITRAEWRLIGLDHVSAPDSNELNIALASGHSLDLGTTPQTNLQLIVDSLNALDQVKYGNSTGVTLTDLTNIGVVGVNEGGNEPTLEAVNAVLYDEDVSADHTNSVQDVVDALFVLNESNDSRDIGINALGLETIGITSNLGFSDDELDYINNRISENDPANSSGDGNYTNDVAELQALVDFVGDKNIYMGTSGDDDISYNNAELHDGQEGIDLLFVDGGMSIDLSEVQNIEEIILNNNNSSLNTTLGTALNEITASDIIDVTDENNLLYIVSNGTNSTETIHLDTTEFTFDSLSGGYNIYSANAGSVVVQIEENIIIE